MELFLLILRNVAIVIAAVYLLLVIVSVSFVCSFASILSHHNNDLTVILTNKKDSLVNLADALSGCGAKLDKKHITALQDFDLKRIQIQDGEEAKNARDELTSIYEYLIGVTTSVNLDDECQKNLANLNELEKVYRHHLMMYNADVLGYNFWINFFPTRYIFKIFKLKKKDNI